ncbi:hypothetical protein QU783_25970 [Escherichia coli]|nr:hypothetical protein [Escherichia coli]
MAEDKPLTKQQQKTVEASAQIKQDPPKGNDLAFTHSILCQVGLPRSKPEGREFMRRSGGTVANSRW